MKNPSAIPAFHNKYLYLLPAGNTATVAGISEYPARKTNLKKYQTL